MKELEFLLERSISQYQAILDQIFEEAKALEQARPQHIEACSGRLNEMREEARRIDEALADLVRKEETRFDASSLFQKRRELMRRVLEQNNLLSDKIHGINSVISDEISQIKKGRTAMAGYKGQRKPKGKVLGYTC
jgi:predicted ribosome quality control (RQC) complex YloA/Tae2 family protein